MKKLMFALLIVIVSVSMSFAYNFEHRYPETRMEEFAQTAIYCGSVFDNMAKSGQFPHKKYKNLAKTNFKYADRFVGKKLAKQIKDMVYPIVVDQFGHNYAYADSMALEYGYECQDAGNDFPAILRRYGK
jgi:hypothetical protein